LLSLKYCDWSDAAAKTLHGNFVESEWYDTLRYGRPTVYLRRRKKLTVSQLNLPHGINEKFKRESRN